MLVLSNTRIINQYAYLEPHLLSAHSIYCPFLNSGGPSVLCYKKRLGCAALKSDLINKTHLLVRRATGCDHVLKTRAHGRGHTTGRDCGNINDKHNRTTMLVCKSISTRTALEIILAEFYRKHENGPVICDCFKHWYCASRLND